jgi:hypothetical protein
LTNSTLIQGIYIFQIIILEYAFLFYALYRSGGSCWRVRRSQREQLVRKFRLYANFMLTICRCSQPVYIYQSNDGGCDKGPNGICQGQPGAAPYTLPPGTQGQSIAWINNGQGTSVKVAKDPSFGQILQVEYTFTGPTLFWDLSNLDGAGASVTGTPFAADNVKISPSGAGLGTGTCNVIKCTANQVCADAYQHPDDTATKVSYLLQTSV